MRDNKLLTLLREVKSGAVSIEEARTALEGVSLTEEQYTSAVDHGVFNAPKPASAPASRAAEMSWVALKILVLAEAAAGTAPLHRMGRMVEPARLRQRFPYGTRSSQ